MANQAAKKQKQKNDSILKTHFYIGFGIFVFYVLYRILFHWASFGFWNWIGLALIVVLHFLSWSGIKELAKVSYDEKGELTYGGSDLSMAGFSQYYFDILYICWFVQVTSALISDKFFYTFLVIPAFALYKLWDSVLKPWIFDSREETPEETERLRKKREKAERRANRVRFVRG